MSKNVKFALVAVCIAGVTVSILMLLPTTPVAFLVNAATGASVGLSFPSVLSIAGALSYTCLVLIKRCSSGVQELYQTV